MGLFKFSVFNSIKHCHKKYVNIKGDKMVDQFIMMSYITNYSMIKYEPTREEEDK